MATRFAGFCSLRKAGYMLRSAGVLGALGYSLEGIEPEHGLSLRGTSDDQLFSGDVVRKLLVKMEAQADLSQPARLPPPEPSVQVKVRERTSRRAVKQMKSGGWQLNKLSSTRYSEIVFYILTVVLSYSVYHLFANTQAGARFADMTRQAIPFSTRQTNRADQ